MERIKKLQNYKSQNNTSVISLYIPPNYTLSLLSQKLTYEKAMSTNIKNKNNRKGVLSSITKIQSYLKNIKSIPETGMVLFAEQCI